jgi:hypothetical protein
MAPRMMSQVGSVVSLTAAIVALASGCGSAPDDAEQLGTTAQASIDGSDCKTAGGYTYNSPNGCNDNGCSKLIGSNPSCGYASTTSTSPNSSYTNAGNCSYAYISEVTGTTGRALTFTVGWNGGALNSSNCSWAVLGLAGFGRKTDGTWDYLGQATLQGHWYSGLFSYCGFVVTSGSMPSLSSGHSYNAVRASVAASAGFLSPVSVTGGVSYGPGPCTPQPGAQMTDGPESSQREPSNASETDGVRLYTISGSSVSMVPASE